MWKLKDDSDCPVDFPGNWGYYNMDTQSLDTDNDGTLIQDSFRINLFDFDWLELLANTLVKSESLCVIQSESDLKMPILKLISVRTREYKSSWS